MNDKVESPEAYRDEINDDVAAAIASLKGETNEPSADATPVVSGDDQVVSDAAISDTQGSDASEDGRKRGPDGKFIAKEGAPEKVEAPEPKLPSEESQTKPTAEQPSTAVSSAPVSWAAEAKSAWATLPPAIQNAVIKREREASDGFRQYSEQVRNYERALTPVVQESQRLGLNTEQGIQRLVDGHHFLEQQPEQAILWLAQKNGIDLANLASNPPAAPQPVRADPQFAQVSQTVQSLQERLDALTLEKNGSLVEQFASSNPHYSDIEESLPGLIKELQATQPHLSPAETLKQAYDRAIWLNPDVRARIIAEQNGAQQKVADLQRKSSQASRAAVSVKGSSAQSAPPPKREPSNGTVYDDVRAAYDQLRA